MAAHDQQVVSLAVTLLIHSKPARNRQAASGACKVANESIASRALRGASLVLSGVRACT